MAVRRCRSGAVDQRRPFRRRCRRHDSAWRPCFLPSVLLPLAAYASSTSLRGQALLAWCSRSPFRPALPSGSTIRGGASLGSEAAALVVGVTRRPRLRGAVVVFADSEDASGGEKKRGYQFGDLFINKLTGKDKYEFGDLSRFLGGKLEEAACSLTGKDSYEFGDISRMLDAKAKEGVRRFTGKENYEFGDISKEIARRVSEGEVDPEDLSLLLRILVTSGIGLTPVAHLLPIQILVNILNWNLQAEASMRVSGALSGAVAKELDRRAKGAVLGEDKEDYVLGDWTKAQVQKAVSGITGKDDYEFGDISRAVISKLGDLTSDEDDGSAVGKEASRRGADPAGGGTAKSSSTTRAKSTKAE